MDFIILQLLQVFSKLLKLINFCKKSGKLYLKELKFECIMENREPLIFYAVKHNIPVVEQIGYYDFHPGLPLVFETIKELYRKFKDKIILYGGQAATKIFWGARVLRTQTNDIDVVIKKDQLENILAGQGTFYYHKKYDYFYFYLNNIQIVFSYAHIHDWNIPQDFYDSARDFKFDTLVIRVCSPEYLIALKLRRNFYAIREGHPFFGKDALDILNILTAFFYDPGKEELDLNKLTTLVHTHVSPEKAVAAGLLEQVEHYLGHYRKADQEKIGRYYRSLLRSL